MKYLFNLIILAALLFTAIANASGRVPFGHQIVPVQNYSRATEQIAISGLIGDGGAKALASHGFKQSLTYVPQMKELLTKKHWLIAMA